VVQRLVATIDRLDGEGLLPRANRPEPWAKTTARLQRAAGQAQSWAELGHVFKQLDATYPNLHAHLTLAPYLDVAATQGKLQLPVQFAADGLSPAASSDRYRISSIDPAALPGVLPPNLPKVGDALVAINGRPLASWQAENFIFCKLPLRVQCDQALFRDLQSETLSWWRAQPLTFTLARGERRWTIRVPARTVEAAKTAVAAKAPAKVPCEVSPDRYPGFQLVYRGFHACAYENPALPRTQLIRLDSFFYRDAPEDGEIGNTGDEVEAFWNRYWKTRSASSRRVILDVTQNHGGEAPVLWYGLFFTRPFQEEYVSFRRFAELSSDDVLDGVLYGDGSKRRFIEGLRRSGVWDRVGPGGLLPPIPQFCAPGAGGCETARFKPRENHFRGQVRVIVDAGCISSCVGLIWNLGDVLGPRTRYFGFPDSGDSAFSRANVDLSLSPTGEVRVEVASDAAPLPDWSKGALLRQRVSVSRSTDASGKVLSGKPRPLTAFIAPRAEESADAWVARVLARIVAKR
jgi:hypothetical protein